MVVVSNDTSSGVVIAIANVAAICGNLRANPVVAV